MKCINCDSITANPKYCSNTCQQNYQYEKKVLSWLSEDISPGIKLIRRYLKQTRVYECSVCKLSSWNEKEITLEVEHKDGNSGNNHIDNLCWICPNCHSQTDTYKAKNKGNGRHARRQRYAEGKSF